MVKKLVYILTDISCDGNFNFNGVKSFDESDFISNLNYFSGSN